MEHGNSRTDAKITSISRFTHLFPGETLTELQVEHRVLNPDEEFNLNGSELAQLNKLTSELQQHLNKVNCHRLQIQTFTEAVLEVMDVHQKSVELWLLRDGGRVVGYAVSLIDQHPVIDTLIIGQKYRGQGLGTKLLQSIRAAKKNHAIKLIVVRKDKVALGFYLAQGGFVDFDHLSRFTHLIIFPPLSSDRSLYALSREPEMGTEGQGMDY